MVFLRSAGKTALPSVILCSPATNNYILGNQKIRKGMEDVYGELEAMKIQEDSYKGVTYEVYAREADHRWSALVMIDFPGTTFPPTSSVETSYVSSDEAIAAGHKTAKRLIENYAQQHRH
ncbi:hypothetical protein [Chitinolyticbacter meiyuanensis]|uniref:hypothetical protein n=1 Tax=Chitinolyticbacter meiyuanensis TaxID=682798 RepID=UPI0011E5B858|nr:hypothetical protein [Chitinolyticbacter meiyuanensis]